MTFTTSNLRNTAVSQYCKYINCTRCWLPPQSANWWMGPVGEFPH